MALTRFIKPKSTEAPDSARLNAQQVSCLILSGGGGSRLWPVSTPQTPKQFLPLNPAMPLEPLLVSAARRVQALHPQADSSFKNQTFFLTGHAMAPQVVASLMAHQLDALAPHLITEPKARNTAAAIALALAYLNQHHPTETPQQDILVFLPADHAITDESAFRHALDVAIDAAVQHQSIITLGILPDAPETGYGYIQINEPVTVKTLARTEAVAVKRFVEKPTQSVAEGYVAGGDYLWNAGIFIVSRQTLLEAFIAHCTPLGNLLCQPEPHTAMLDAFETLDNISFDYAVMEQAEDVMVVPVSCGWSDLGSWDALADLAATSVNTHAEAQGELMDGNQRLGPMATADDAPAVIFESTQRVTVYQDDAPVSTGMASVNGKPMVLVGLKDCLVVDSPHGLLIMQRGTSQHVKQALTRLKALQAVPVSAPASAHKSSASSGTTKVLV